MKLYIYLIQVGDAAMRKLSETDWQFLVRISFANGRRDPALLNISTRARSYENKRVHINMYNFIRHIKR